MATPKRGSNRKEGKPEAGPTASRPHMPGYGIPKDRKGLLPWSHVVERMTKAERYWICTVSPTGRPHATPVDGLWIDDRLYFGGMPGTRRNRNLTANPAVAVHLENSMDVVILHGDAEECRSPDRALTTRLAEASAEKYGYSPKPEDFGKGGTFVVRPRVAFAWKNFPKDATRWHFPDHA